MDRQVDQGRDMGHECVSEIGQDTGRGWRGFACLIIAQAALSFFRSRMKCRGLRNSPPIAPTAATALTAPAASYSSPTRPSARYHTSRSPAARPKMPHSQDLPDRLVRPRPIPPAIDHQVNQSRDAGRSRLSEIEQQGGRECVSLLIICGAVVFRGFRVDRGGGGERGGYCVVWVSRSVLG